MASAKQRSGRAGRLKPGKCYRLYTEAEMMNRMQTNTIPEILRTNLSSFLLTLKALGVHNILAFDLMTLPSVPALCQGLETLYVLGAIDEKTNLTSVGSIMAEFPTEPQVSKMLLESLSNNCSKEILCVAAAQQVRSLFYQPRTAKQNMDFDTAVRDIVDNKSDHVTYVRLMQMNDTTPLNENDCKEYFINYNALRRANEIRKQLTKCIRKYGPVKGLDDEGYRGEDEISACIRKCITGGYFSNTAKLGNDGRYYSLRGNHMLSVSPTSMFQRFGLTSEYILFGETYDGRRGGIEVNFVSAIEGNWLREIAPHYWD
jgi:HrpA-like RNA helicase